MSAYVAPLLCDTLSSENKSFLFYLSTLRICEYCILLLTNSCAGKVTQSHTDCTHTLRRSYNGSCSVSQVILMEGKKDSHPSCPRVFGTRSAYKDFKRNTNRQIKSLFNTFVLDSLSQLSGKYMGG